MSKKSSMKIGVLGFSDEGKDYVVGSFLDLEFLSNTYKTVGEEKLEASYKLNNEQEVKLIIYRSSSEKLLSYPLNSVNKGIDGFILVFDPADEKELNKLEEQLANLESTIKRNIPMVLFAYISDDKKKEK